MGPEWLMPLTRPMICPLADGGAAAILVSERKARQLGIHRPVRIVASVVNSYFEHPDGAAENVSSIAADASTGARSSSTARIFIFLSMIARWHASAIALRYS